MIFVEVKKAGLRRDLRVCRLGDFLKLHMHRKTVSFALVSLVLTKMNQ